VHTVAHKGVRRVSTTQEATTSWSEHRVIIGVKKDDNGSTLVEGINDLRSTSFYLTNVREQTPYFLWRKGFEVCGMLADVFLAELSPNQPLNAYIHYTFHLKHMPLKTDLEYYCIYLSISTLSILASFSLD